MEIQYDDQIMRRIIHEYYGKPKGISYEDFSDEINTTIDVLNQEHAEAEEFRKEYNRKHKLCPKCGSPDCISTLMGFVINIKEKESNMDLNNCVCCGCGDKHVTHDRVEVFENK